MMMAAGAFTGLLAAGACDDDDPTAPPEEMTFSFETGLQGWTEAGTDLQDPPVTWDIERTTDVANSGDASVRLMLDNVNDAGKIWIVRGFEAEPGRTYEVEIDFALGTRDWGDVNLWTVIAGAHAQPPQDAGDLDFRDDTGNGLGSDQGYVWIDKDYTSTVTANAEGMIYVAIGVWGTYEVSRTYYVDDVVIEIEDM